MECVKFGLEELEKAIDDIISIGFEFKRNDFNQFGYSSDYINNNGWSIYYEEWCKEEVHNAIYDLVSKKYSEDLNCTVIVPLNPFEILCSILRDVYSIFSGAVNRFENYLKFALYELWISNPEMFNIHIADDVVKVKVK